MKKIFKTSLLVVTAIAFNVACTKDMEIPAPLDQEELVTMTVSIPGELTKVSLTQDEDADGAVKLAWQGTDNIRVIDHNDAADNKLFEIQEGYTDHHASFDGSPVVASRYDIIYPGKYESVEAAQAVQFAVQNQTGNASTAQLEYMAFLSNVDSYLGGIEFSEEWATAHGGTFKQTGILRFRVQLPEGFTGNVASVTVNAPSPIFYKSNALVDSEKVSSLKLNFSGEGAVPASGVVTGYLMLPWEDVTMAANTQLSIIVETAAHSFYTKTFTPSASEAKTFKTGRVNALKINKNSFGAASTTFAGGSGTAADPWLIANTTHMGNIASNLSAGSTKYFKMIDDVDMSGETWTPVVNDKPFDRYIDFNGNHKTITNLSCSTGYASLFGIFNGEAYNLIIKNAVITPPSGYRGAVFAAILGNNITSNVSGITLINCNVGTSENRPTTVAGMFVGEIRSDFSINNVLVHGGSIYGSTNVGGLLGFVKEGCTGTISMCATSATVNGTGQNVGGFIGSTSGNVAFTNCGYNGISVSTSHSGEAHLGGFCGAMGVSGSIDGCYVDTGTGSAITVSGGTTANMVGGFIGMAGTNGDDNTGSITKCRVNNTSVTGTAYTGGFSGAAYTSISKSWVDVKSTVAAKGKSCGGFVGYLRYRNVENCYSRANITASSTYANIGGFVGNNAGSCTVTKCYSAGSVSGGAAGSMGSFVGNNAGTVSNCISWKSTPAFKGSGTDGSNCYTIGASETGTVRSHAISLDWSDTIWTLGDSDPDYPEIIL